MSEMDIASGIGARVKSERHQRGLSRRALAETARVSERYLVQLESGEANITVGVLSKIAHALGLPLLSLLGDRTTGSSRHDRLEQLVTTMHIREREEAATMLDGWLTERRRRLKGVALLGLRGAGKSTLGQALSRQSGLPLVSITREIEARAGMALPELFNLGGTEAYRALENDVIDTLAAREDPIILETAGGVVGNPHSLTRIFENFRSIWLRASPEDHLDRVARQGDLRPMSGNPKALEHLRTLLAQREPDYARADIVLDTSGRSVEACLDDLMAALGWKKAA